MPEDSVPPDSSLPPEARKEPRRDDRGPPPHDAESAAAGEADEQWNQPPLQNRKPDRGFALSRLEAILTDGAGSGEVFRITEITVARRQSPPIPAEVEVVSLGSDGTETVRRIHYDSWFPAMRSAQAFCKNLRSAFLHIAPKAQNTKAAEWEKDVIPLLEAVAEERFIASQFTSSAKRAIREFMSEQQDPAADFKEAMEQGRETWWKEKSGESSGLICVPHDSLIAWAESRAEHKMSIPRANPAALHDAIEMWLMNLGVPAPCHQEIEVPRAFGTGTQVIKVWIVPHFYDMEGEGRNLL